MGTYQKALYVQQISTNEHGRKGDLFSKDHNKQILKTMPPRSTQQPQQCYDHQGNMTCMTACLCRM